VEGPAVSCRPRRLTVQNLPLSERKQPNQRLSDGSQSTQTLPALKRLCLSSSPTFEKQKTNSLEVSAFSRQFIWGSPTYEGPAHALEDID
jgi:hypothetical protein